MARDSFLFKKAWRNAICGLAIQVRMSLYEAIIDYCLYGTESELKGQARATFRFIKQDIDSMNAAEERRQQHLSLVRHEAGRKSGEARRKSSAELKETKRTNVQFVQIAENQPSPSRTRIEVNQDNIDYKNINSKKKKENAEKKDKDEDNFDNREAEDNFDNIDNNVQSTKRFIDYFNASLTKAGSLIPHQCTYTERRRVAITARANEHGKVALKTMVEKAAASPFLNGGNDRAWVATLDWLLRPNNFVKVIEGNYDAIQNSKFKNQNSKFNVQSSMFKVNGYGKTQQSDNRRGVAAQMHSADEY